ncbi:Ferric uptake regulator, Fur family (modular protein) [uncultured Desulfatiglans sp.]|nr:Ferric uptake regulator, Fur family (modular protein) [uncultured Desulfatiglans sp.]
MTTGTSHRMTRQREVILEEIRKMDCHPTADSIYEAVRKRLPRISMGTVYRNLDILASCGMIRKLEPDFPQMHFDCNTKEHYHVTCIKCGKIEDAPVDMLKDSVGNLESAMGKLTKYGIFGHRLEFLGICAECRAKGETLPVEDGVPDAEDLEDEKETKA